MNRRVKWIGLGVMIALVAVTLLSLRLGAQTQPKITWATPEVYAGITRTTKVTKSLTFTSDQALQNFTVEAIPAIVPYVQIQPNTFKQMPAGQPQTVTLTFSAPAGAQFGAYDGTIHIRTGQKTLPQTLKASVTFAVVPLPPDPGNAGKATLTGIDADGDGVRDDVQRWIVFAVPASERMRQALYQEARAMQQIVTGGGSSSAFDAFDRSATCFFGVGDMAQVSPDDLAKLSNKIVAQSINTDARVKAYLSANNLANGRTGLPIKFNDRVADCTFDPNSLEN